MTTLSYEIEMKYDNGNSVTVVPRSSLHLRMAKKEYAKGRIQRSWLYMIQTCNPPEVIDKTSGSEDWNMVWGQKSRVANRYKDLALTCALRAGNGNLITVLTRFRLFADGIAIRHEFLYIQPSKFFIYERTFIGVNDFPTTWAARNFENHIGPIPLDTYTLSYEADRAAYKLAGFNGEDNGGLTPITLENLNVKRSGNSFYMSIHEAGTMTAEPVKVEVKSNVIRLISQYGPPSHVSGQLKSHWKTIILVKSAAKLIESDLVLNVNESPEAGLDFSYVTPGLAMWDWRLHEQTVYDFPYGSNTQTFIHLIEFAGGNGVPYVVFDALWYGPDEKKYDPVGPNPKTVDMNRVCQAAVDRGVGVFLYVNAVALLRSGFRAPYGQNGVRSINGYQGMDALFSVYRSWDKVPSNGGVLTQCIVGIKEGFVNSNGYDGGVGEDPQTSRYLHIEDMAKRAVAFKMMLLIHEPPKPTGVQRKYPNILSYEYVESQQDGPKRPMGEADMTRVLEIPFIMNLAGPVDRGQGLFNLDGLDLCDPPQSCFPRMSRMVQSTLVGQIAQGFLYFTGIWPLPDAPEKYREFPFAFFILQTMVRKWTNTRVLQAEIGVSLVMHRTSFERDGKEAHHVCGLSSKEGNIFNLRFSDFLPPQGTYKTQILADAPDSSFLIGSGRKELFTQQVSVLTDASTFRSFKGSAFCIFMIKT